MTNPFALSLSGVSKRFGAIVALENASLAVRAGSVHTVLGENGAGKTTLMRIAYGMVMPDRGTVAIHGLVRRLRSPRDAIQAGVGMVHQHFSNVPSMTVAENVALGGHGRFDLDRTMAHVRRVAAESGLTIDPAARARDLPVGAQQRLELIKALAMGARVLILDEPTAVLAPPEAADLLRWLRQFADAGGSVVLVTHKVVEALRVADELTVLRLGQVVERGAAAGFSEAKLTRAMFPADVDGGQPSASSVSSTEHATVVVEASHVFLTDAGRPHIIDATFDIHAGELIGIVGVEGSGHAELIRALAGLTGVNRGALRLPPADAVSFVPEDRHRDALILDFSLIENTALRGAGTRSGLLRWGDMEQRTEALLTSFDVRAASTRAPARTLSGGNQQRFVLAREIQSVPTLLVAENPTRGLDLQSTEAVRERLRAAARSGAAVVVYSSDLDEVLMLASRILVVYDHTVREAVFDRDLIGRAMVGAA